MKHEDEVMVETTFGTYPMSQLPEINKRREAQRKQYFEEQKRLAEERMAKSKAAGTCPLSFVNDFTPGCKLEKCALYSESGCILAKMADKSTAKTVGERCPIKGRPCVEDCAMNIDGGCVITGLFDRKEN
jgi:hypothetical protein